MAAEALRSSWAPSPAVAPLRPATVASAPRPRRAHCLRGIWCDDSTSAQGTDAMIHTHVTDYFLLADIAYGPKRPRMCFKLANKHRPVPPDQTDRGPRRTSFEASGRRSPERVYLDTGSEERDPRLFPVSFRHPVTECSRAPTSSPSHPSFVPCFSSRWTSTLFLEGCIRLARVQDGCVHGNHALPRRGPAVFSRSGPPTPGPGRRRPSCPAASRLPSWARPAGDRHKRSAARGSGDGRATQPCPHRA